jgi:23S rRNA (adenine2503-C2)-methyltransferase
MSSAPSIFTDLQSLTDRLLPLAPKACHRERVLRAWVEGKTLQTSAARRGYRFPAALDSSLGEIETELAAVAVIASEHIAVDEAVRFLMRLADGQTVETVLLPRDGLCISSQVGCAVGCVFCMTGRSGLLRQLESFEMLAQVAIARRKRPVQKIVFMGMGEPAHNLENVIETIQVLGTFGGVAHKNIVFSTVGDLRVFERLPQERVKPALALSLHTTNPLLRQKLLPRAPKLSPELLVDLGEAYARVTGYPIQYQWTLIKGVNDSDEEIDGIARLLRDKYALMNFIPFNSIDDSSFERPSAERAAEMARALQQRGILTKLRQSAGQDVDAGCGQLRARETPVTLAPVSEWRRRLSSE